MYEPPASRFARRVPLLLCKKGESHRIPKSQFKISQNCAKSVKLERMLCYIMAHAIYESERAGDEDFDMNTREQQESRQSMWSVRPALVPFYFAFFTLSVVAGNAFIVWYEVWFVTADAAPETLIGIIQGVGWVGLAAAIGTITLTEIMEHAMVMANWFRQNYLETAQRTTTQRGPGAGSRGTTGGDQGMGYATARC